MPEGSEFLLAMKNGVSGPAKDAKASLQSLKDQLKGVDAQMKALQRANAIYKQAGPAFADQIKKNNDAIAGLKIASGDLKDGLAKLKPEVDDQTKQEKEWEKEAKAAAKESEALAGQLTGALTAGFVAVGAAALYATKKLIDWTIAGGKAAIEAGAFKEQQEAMYNLFGGGKGQAIFAQIDKLGNVLHVPLDKAHEYAKDLITQGIQGPNRLEQSVKSVAMLAKIGGDEAAQKLKGILSEAAKSKSTAWWLGGRGVFTVTREQLVGTGVTIDQVYGALAKRLGKSNQEIRMMMMQGRITADQGIDALNDVVERGGIGDVFRKMTMGLDEVVIDLQNNFKALFRDIDYKGFLKELHGFASMFDMTKASGKDMHDKLVGFFNGIFSAGKMAVRGLRIGLLYLEIGMLKLLIFLAPQIKQFKKLYDEFKKSGGASMMLSIAWAYLKGSAIFLAFGLKLMFIEFNGLFKIVNLLLRPLQHIERSFKRLSNFAKAEGGWKKLGLEMMQGLLQGILAGKDAVVGAVKGVATDALKGAKETLGIKSPSREMMKLGQYSAEGFEKGAEGMSFGKSQLRVNVDSGGKGGGTFAPQVSITISGAQGPQAAWEEFEQKATDWLEKLRLQFAGGTTG